MSRSYAPESIRPRPSMFDSLAPAAFAVAMAGTVGCSISPPDEAIGARGEAIDRTTQALAVGSLRALEGKYGAGCLARDGAWGLVLDGTSKLELPPLSVVKDNDECELVVTAVIADGRHEVSTPFVLKDAYSAKPTQVGSDKEAFFINAKLASSKMDGRLDITVIFSDDPKAVSSAYGASYATVSAGGGVSKVEGPDYKVDLEGGLKILVNAKSVVSTADGSARLVAGAIPGSSFIVDGGKLPESPTFAMVDEVYRAFSATQIDKGDVVVPAAAFSLSGVSLAGSAVRTVVIRGGTAEMPAYQLVRVTFNPPS